MDYANKEINLVILKIYIVGADIVLPTSLPRILKLARTIADLVGKEISNPRIWQRR